ncbi:MAG TPA: protein phosphatase 2C domain-containing protein [Gemmataceae bacterium]|jgi:protein phosphatase|nr:protein phosphatase 2C domain-containing protein [Gemmataceae bacterium]
MAQFVLRVGCHTAQGVRTNNEDRYVVDRANNVFLVADGMGGQELGEQASGLAAEIIPRVVHDQLAADRDASKAMQKALSEANQAIVHAGRNQPAGRRMGTTAVVALQHSNQVYVAGLGDSRAYLIRGDQIQQLTVDHSVAQALVSTGVLSPEEARNSPWQHVLHKFLGCAEMTDGAEVYPFTPQADDRLLLASDGLTNHITEEDLRAGPRRFADPQVWAEYLVQTALERGSRDNVTCIVVAFDPE